MNDSIQADGSRTSGRTSGRAGMPPQWAPQAQVEDLGAWDYAPNWLSESLRPILEGGEQLAEMTTWSRYRPPDAPTKLSAVLVLFGSDTVAVEPAAGRTPSPPACDVLLTRRAAHMRSHAGQIAFPGGSAETTDGSPIDTAMREAREETGLDPSGVVPLVQLPGLWLPPSGFTVTPVVGWWHRPTAVTPNDPDEVAEVFRAPVRELLAPENRTWVSHPTGYRGPGFVFDNKLVWGFTGTLLDRLFAAMGWEEPWHETQSVVSFDWEP